MASTNYMKVGQFHFKIHSASFRYATQSWSGPGWDFNIAGKCTNDSDDLFPNGAVLRTECSPFPLKNSEDLTGVEVFLPGTYDEETGEPFFGLLVMEEHDVSNVRMRFVERDGNRYRLEVTGTVASSVLGSPVSLEMEVWADQLPAHAYPVS